MQSLKISLLSVLLLLGMGFSTSCTRYRDADTEDRLEKIQQKIDGEQYEESIQELNEILKSEPSNERARVILASVYIRRAGITVKNYFDLARIATIEASASEPLIDVASLKKLAGENVSQIKNLTSFLQKINESTAMADQIIKKFEAIPSVSEPSAIDLQRALIILEQMRAPTEGMLLYRGVIKLYYFKYLWVNQLLLPIGENRLCASRLTDIAQKIKVMNDYSFKMIIDISHGFPNETKDIKTKAQEISASLLGAQNYLMNLSSSGQTLRQVVTSQLKEFNVRNFSCDF